MICEIVCVCVCNVCVCNVCVCSVYVYSVCALCFLRRQKERENDT